MGRKGDLVKPDIFAQMVDRAAKDSFASTCGMFGTNKGNAECLKPDDPRYHYYKETT